LGERASKGLPGTEEAHLLLDYETKALTVKELTEDGQLEAIISTFDQIDRDGDIMLADAFSEADGKAIPMVWSHNWDQPVGKGRVSRTKETAVFTGQFFLDTSAGQNAYQTVKAMGDLQQYSIGFRIRDADFGYKEDASGSRIYVRTIKDIELFEASPVLVGAAYGTRTLAVKAAQSEDEEGQILAIFAQIDQLKAGAVLSNSNLSKLHSALTSMMALHEASNCDMGDDCPMAPMMKAVKPEDEFMGYASPARREAQLRELDAALAAVKL
jgi:HK97 family phage prohead protease